MATRIQNPVTRLDRYRHEFLTDTPGTGLLTNLFVAGDEWRRHRAPARTAPSWRSRRPATGYAIATSRRAGPSVRRPRRPVYEGIDRRRELARQRPRRQLTKEKSSPHARLHRRREHQAHAPPRMNLEQCLEWTSRGRLAGGNAEVAAVAQARARGAPPVLAHASSGLSPSGDRWRPT